MFSHRARLSCTLSVCTMAGAAIAPQARADDASCKSVSEAMTKMAGTPYHETAITGGKSFEKIYTTTALYLGSDGHWLKTPATPQTLLHATRESGLVFSDCKALRADSVDGQAATVYAAHYRTTAPASNSDAQIWIADASGLPVQTEADGQAEGRKVHTSTHISYSNVQIPADAK